MSLPEEKLLVRRIREGTVIDHIEGGRSLEVLKILGIGKGTKSVVTVAMNVPSGKLGRKDIVKIEGRFLSPEETDRIALIAPRATINIIKGYRVVEKRKVRLPSVIYGMVRCPNPTCITNSGEPIGRIFDVIDREKPLLRCRYCGRILKPEELVMD